ncbi:putative reverse transcriptase domain-containing protein [Tanacetum coccineum]
MKKIFQRLPLGRGMDVLSYGYAFWINQCTNGFHGLEEPGLAGYYRRFITNSSKVAKPLASLTQKIQKYEWVKEQKEAFQTLKDNLCDTSILSLPDGSKEFVVYCDASNQGLGCAKRTLMIDEAHASSIRCAPFEALYERKCRSPILVEVGNKVMLEVSSWKDVVHFGKKDLLAPRYVGPFEIIKGIGPMAKSLKPSRISIVKVCWKLKARL